MTLKCLNLKFENVNQGNSNIHYGCHMCTVLVMWISVTINFTITSVSLYYTYLPKRVKVYIYIFLLVPLVLNLAFLISESISFSGYSLFANHDLIFSLFCSKSVSLDHNLLMRKLWLKTTERLVSFGWAHEYTGHGQ